MLLPGPLGLQVCLKVLQTVLFGGLAVQDLVLQNSLHNVTNLLRLDPKRLLNVISLSESSKNGKKK